jgi:iron complex transport system permease protein
MTMTPMMSRRTILFFVSGLLLILLFMLDLWTGSVRLSFAEVWNALFSSHAGADETAASIVRSFRLPKAIVAVLAGAAGLFRHYFVGLVR